MRSAPLFACALAAALAASAPVGASALAPGSSPSNVVELAPYAGNGDPVALGGTAGSKFLAVRFEPPFAAPYTITALRFSSFTTGGAPAVFPSVRLLEFDPLVHQLKWGTPLLQLAPFTGSSGGVNELEANIPITEPGKTFFLCIEVPALTNPLPYDYPLLAIDTSLDKGWFASSYSIPGSSPNTLSLIQYKNLIASMVCELTPGTVPLQAPTALRANRTHSGLMFTYTLPRNERMDGTHGPAHTITKVELLGLKLNLTWQVIASSLPESLNSVVVPNPQAFIERAWAVRAIEEDGLRSALSDAIEYRDPFPGDAGWFYEPDGSFEEAATNVTSGGLENSSGIYPAGDQDYYALSAHPGQELWIGVGTSSSLASTHLAKLHLVASLLDERGHVVARADTTEVARSQPTLVYRVPDAGRDRTSPRTFVLKVEDYRGSWFSPGSAPVPLMECGYVLAYGAVDAPNAKGASSMRLQLSTAAAQGTKGVVLRYSVPSGMESAPALVQIFDTRGRLVQRLNDSGIGRERAVVWDRTSRNGRPVVGGVYFAKVEAGGSNAVIKIVITK